MHWPRSLSPALSDTLSPTMTQLLPHHVLRRLSLDSSLADLARVSPWVGELAGEFGIPSETRFAIELCLEEVLSNVVRHGYAGESGHDLIVQFVPGDGDAVFVVEDRAPAFEPRPPAETVPDDLSTIRPGGQGLRLLFRFANSVAYERLADGNRVTLRFELKINESVTGSRIDQGLS